MSSLTTLNLGTRSRPAPGEFEPVRRGAFRVLGLAASASQREVFDAAASLRLALKLGVEKSFESDARWLGPVARGESEVRDALGRLSDPKSRAAERVFWFHAPPAADVDDLEALRNQAGALRGAGGRWAEHDAALLMLAGVSRLDPSLGAQAAWAEAFGLWRGLWEAEEFWSLLVAADLLGEYEQLVTYGEVKALRGRVPRLVSEPLAERAKTAAVRGETNFCRRALSVLRGAGLPRPLLEEYENDILGPLEDRLQEECDAVFAPSETFSATRTRHERASLYNSSWRGFEYGLKPSLAAFVAAGGEGSPFVRRALARAALKLSELSSKYRTNEQTAPGLELLKRAARLAPPGSDARLQVEEQLRALAPEAVAAAEREYAASLAEELAARTDPPRAPAAVKAPRVRAGGVLDELGSWMSNGVMWLLLLGGCFLLSRCGLLLSGPSRRSPPPALYNINYNFNYRPDLNLNLSNFNYNSIVPPRLINMNRERRKKTRRGNVNESRPRP
ncbi:MAG TPA: hypothetical protein VGX48_23500 [Pyrinomonadaceae bacterium]|nr:hypothetical protein [Pyrinomonadaceae bacterium]